MTGHFSLSRPLETQGALFRGLGEMGPRWRDKRGQKKKNTGTQKCDDGMWQIEWEEKHGV